MYGKLKHQTQVGNTFTCLPADSPLPSCHSQFQSGLIHEETGFCTSAFSFQFCYTLPTMQYMPCTRHCLIPELLQKENEWTQHDCAATIQKTCFIAFCKTNLYFVPCFICQLSGTTSQLRQQVMAHQHITKSRYPSKISIRLYSSTGKKPFE